MGRESNNAKLISNSLMLKVKNGLSQGELIKIADTPIIIGGSVGCDVFLAEPNLSEPSLIVERVDEQITVSHIKTSTEMAFLDMGDQKQLISDQNIIQPGQQFCVGGIWIELCGSTSNQLCTLPPHLTREQYSSRNSLQSEEKPKWILFKAGSLVLSSLSICALTISVAQGVNKPNELEIDNYADIPMIDTQKHVIEIAPKNIKLKPNDLSLNTYETAPFDVSGAIQASNQDNNLSTLSSEELYFLQSIFKSMLNDRELPPSVNLIQDEKQLVVEGTLDKEKQQILSRMISRFQSEQGIKENILNRVQHAESSLPFDIVQVTSGRYGNIVTNSGKRMFVGDTLEGYQLVAIQDHHLIFSGKSKLTITW